MDKEFEILEHISRDTNITQRKLAERTGLSLGAANILIKRLIKKGLVKVEHINSRALKYMLTPKGVVEKTQRTCEFIKDSYTYITGLNRKIKILLQQQGKCSTVFIMGEEDEIFDIILNALYEINCEGIKLKKEELDKLQNMNSYVILTWDSKFTELLSSNGIRYINILEI